MEEPRKIMRRSVHTFLQNYHHCAVAAASLALPFAVALLLSHPFSSSSLHTSLRTLFLASGFPSSLDFFTVLSLKLSQTISSFVLALPFSLTFLLFSKAYVISFLAHKLSASHGSEGFSVCYFAILRTYLCNSFLLLSANASAFALFFLAFNLLKELRFLSTSFLPLLSVSATVIYSVILANAVVISNLALVSAAAERSSSSSSSSWGYMAIIKACVLIRGRTSTALALALPTNLGLAGVEALFQYRILKSYFAGNRSVALLVPEGILIAYLYAIFVVLDTVVNFLFYQSCKNDQRIDEGEGYSLKIEICETDSGECVGSKGLHEIP